MIPAKPRRRLPPRTPLSVTTRQRTRSLYNKAGFAAILGNENGVIDVPGMPGYVYIREYLGVDTVGDSTYDRAKAVLAGFAGSSGYAVYNGSPVWVDFSPRRQLGILGTDAVGYQQGGGSMTIHNPSNPRIHAYDSTQSYIPLLTKPIATTTTPSLTVHTWPLLWLDIHGTFHHFPGGATDLTAHVPGTADFVNLVLVVMNTDNTTSAYHSTEQHELVPLVVADVQECFDQANAESLPAGLFKMYNGQTTILGEDVFSDIRMRINHPTPHTLPSLPNPVTMNVTLDAGRQLNYHFDCTVTGTFTVNGVLNVL